MSAQILRIFIDGSYLFRVFDPYRRLGYHYSVKRMVDELCQRYNLQGVHYFGSFNPFNEELRKKQEAFYYGVLRDKCGYEVEVLPLQKIAGKLKEKGMDMALGIRMKELSDKETFETAILVAADGDYSYVVRAVQATGKIVVNAYFSIRRSHDLQQTCGRWTRLDGVRMIYPKEDPKKLLTVAELVAKAGRPVVR